MGDTKQYKTRLICQLINPLTVIQFDQHIFINPFSFNIASTWLLILLQSDSKFHLQFTSTANIDVSPHVQPDSVWCYISTNSFSKVFSTQSRADWTLKATVIPQVHLVGLNCWSKKVKACSQKFENWKFPKTNKILRIFASDMVSRMRMAAHMWTVLIPHLN